MYSLARYCSFSFTLTHSFKKTRSVYDIYKKPGLNFLTTATESEKTPILEKTPLLEKWKKYWQDLITDYSEVLKEAIEDGRNHPKRTVFLFTCSAIAYSCFKTNPDEIDFRENVTKCCNEVLLVGKPIRNKVSEDFLTSVETFHNFGIIRRLSFGLFSVIWVDNFSSDLGVYKANCSYLKPQYHTFFNRVIDVGFFGRWWKLNSIMKDYDINIEEWSDTNKGVNSI